MQWCPAAEFQNFTKTEAQDIGVFIFLMYYSVVYKGEGDHASTPLPPPGRGQKLHVQKPHGQKTHGQKSQRQNPHDKKAPKTQVRLGFVS